MSFEIRQDFMDLLQKNMGGNVGRTQNDAKVYSTTESRILDFFSQAGSVRNWDERSIIQLFNEAEFENKIAALKLLFYFRDVTQGKGERRLFRIILNYLCQTEPETAACLLKLVPVYGRWDDIYVAIDTRCEDSMWDIIKNQLSSDIDNYIAKRQISLLAKWLKSEYTHGKKNELGYRTRKALGMSSKNYRKLLSALRAHMDVVERKMSSGRWDEINFEKVPSQTMKRCVAAFYRNSSTFANYIEQVKSGEKTIKASTLYPYQLVAPFFDRGVTRIEAETYNEQWKALPNWLEDATSDALVMCDVSGSMTWGGSGNVLPIHVSVSLALYIAERMKDGPYKNKFMTFSRDPKLVEIRGNALAEKVRNISNAEWGQNTDLKKAMKTILMTAVRNNLAPEDLPKRLIVISDMQFDRGITDDYLIQEIERAFAFYGYQMPLMVWWNVNATNKTQPMLASQEGLMVSGASAETMKAILANKFIRPLDLVYEVINRPRYDLVEDVLEFGK